MPKLTENKERMVQKLTDNEGFFRILAIDHRQVYAELMGTHLGRCPTPQEIIRSKMEIINSFSGKASGYLIDPEYGVPAIIDSGAMGSRGFMLSIEGDDYDTANFGDSYLNPDISVKKIKALGGSMVKLFLYYNPRLPLASRQEELISEVAAECDKEDMPFLLEPILYYEDDEISEAERIALFIEMLERLSEYHVDVFKLEFPGQAKSNTLQQDIEACSMVSRTIKVPWILLSSGVDTQQFLRQLMSAVKGGASGFAIGRSLWGGCVSGDSSPGDSRWEDMINIFDEISEIVRKNAKPLKERYTTE